MTMQRHHGLVRCVDQTLDDMPEKRDPSFQTPPSLQTSAICEPNLTTTVPIGSSRAADPRLIIQKCFDVQSEAAIARRAFLGSLERKPGNQMSKVQGWTNRSIIMDRIDRSEPFCHRINEERSVLCSADSPCPSSCPKVCRSRYT